VKFAAAALLILGAGCASSRAPDLTDPRGLPAPQAVTSVDISDDERTIVVGTLAFRHQPNFWRISEKGDLQFGRAVAPWAPFQVGAPGTGRTFGVGLAYSRVTSPLPTISLFNDEKSEESVLEDSLGERGWLRYGEGDWKSGWLRSLLGDLVVHAGSSLITIRGHNGAVQLLSDGERRKFPLKYERPYRMAGSADGMMVASGYIVPEGAKNPLLSVIDTANASEQWKVAASTGPEIPPLPEPGKDFPELAERFKLAPDAIVPFRVATSVATNTCGSAVALAEYGGRMWVRKGPAIGKWDPPYHQIPFVPRQRGLLRIVSAPGTETVRVEFPTKGLFEVHPDAKMSKVWAVPASWFARGTAGSAWLPTDDDARTIYVFDVAKNAWETAWSFPDAVSDAAIFPEFDAAWVSCWDGCLYRVHRDGRILSTIDVGSPARLKWSRDGVFAVAGTDAGDVLRLEQDGTVKWRLKLPVTEAPPAEPARPVFEGIPIFAVGRTGKEHAYVGDIWLVKTESGGFLVDGAGSSSIPQTIKKIQAAGVKVEDLHHLLHTHSHGDHSGGAYLWRSMGLRIVAPASGSLGLSWLMPMLTDYGVWVPRPVDVPLPLRRAGDETEFTVAGVRIRAVFVPGHSLDSVVYMMEVGGKRVVFTGDIGFQAPSDILHRCWGDTDHAAVVAGIVKTKVLPFKPDVVFTGHGGRADGTGFLEDLVKRSEESIQKAKAK